MKRFELVTSSAAVWNFHDQPLNSSKIGQQMNVFVDQSDATVFVSGSPKADYEVDPVANPTWHEVVLTDGVVSIKWPVTGIKVVSGALETTASLLVD